MSAFPTCSSCAFVAGAGAFGLTSFCSPTNDACVHACCTSSGVVSTLPSPTRCAKAERAVRGGGWAAAHVSGWNGGLGTARFSKMASFGGKRGSWEGATVSALAAVLASRRWTCLIAAVDNEQVVNGRRKKAARDIGP